MDKAEVQRLARLVRIEIADAEAEKLSHEFEAILRYVSEIKGAKLKATNHKLEVGPINTMREDINPHESDLYTEKLLAAAPESVDGYIKVKKIL